MKQNMAILVVDDERDHADGIVESLKDTCPDTMAVYNGKDALEVLDNRSIDIVVTDLKLGGDISGLDVLRRALELNPHIHVILITAYGTIDTCKEAIKQGAYDYLIKPIDIDQLRALVTQAGKEVARYRSDRQTAHDDKIVDGFWFEGVRGENPQIRHVFDVVRRVAATDISVLIQGPSGTGKELLANAIHQNSRRRSGPFVPVNCAGLTETLLESELFGHAKGAFTGATADRKGLFENAHGGTLFLDEIGDMPLNMQAKLLRVLEDGIVTPVGSNKRITVDIRLISATNHDLGQLVDEKKFRQDLFFRIKGVNITLPGLHERPEDIPLLVDYFIDEAAAQIGSSVSGISEPAMNILVNYQWPGNIRQLRTCIRTMIVMADGDQLDVQDIPPEVRNIRQLSGSVSSTKTPLGQMPLDEIEKQAIIETLARTNNNREQAAKILGIGERTLYRKIKEYGLS